MRGVRGRVIVALAGLVACGDDEQQHRRPGGSYALPFCGDGRVDAGESCEAAVLGGASCESLGFGPGILACAHDCRYDLSGCAAPATCGNGGLDGPEVCDGANLGGATCASLGLGSTKHPARGPSS